MNGAGVGGEVQGLRPCADLTMSHRACMATQRLISSAHADGPWQSLHVCMHTNTSSLLLCSAHDRL